MWHLLVFLHVRPANKPTLTVVALYHRKFGRPFFKHFTFYFCFEFFFTERFLKLSPLESWGLRSCGMLRVIGWKLVTVLSGQPVGLIFMCQWILIFSDCMVFEDGTYRLSLTLVTNQPTLHNVTEELMFFSHWNGKPQTAKKSIWESNTGFMQANLSYKFRDIVGLTTNCLLQLYLKLIPRY